MVRDRCDNGSKPLMENVKSRSVLSRFRSFSERLGLDDTIFQSVMYDAETNFFVSVLITLILGLGLGLGLKGCSVFP